MDNKPLIFLVLGFAVILAAFVIVKVMSPTRQSARGRETTINLRELEDPKASKKYVSTSAPGKSFTVSNSPRMLSALEREKLMDSYYQSYDEQQEALETAEKKRHEFMSSMSGRAGKLFKDGLDFAASQDYDKAIDAFLKALKEEPNNMTVRLLAFKKLAALYKQKNDEKKYYVATYKYLEVLEKVEKDPGEIENIRNLKFDIKSKMANYGE